MNHAQASSLTTNLFVLLCGVVLVLWGAASNVWTRGKDASPRWPARWLTFGAGAVIWIVIPLVLARRGVLDRWELPPPAFVVIAVATLCTLGLALSRFSARLIDRVPLAWLVGYQAFRIPVEWLLHRLYLEGVIPVQMTWSGSNFDVVSGIGAAIVAIVLAAGRPARGLLWAWNVTGVLLLANIVVIAALSTPAPFRRFMNEPANPLLGMVPFVLLPTFLVQAALFGHVVVFRALVRRSRG